MEIFEWIMKHPDVRVIISFESDRYVRIMMTIGMMNRVRVFTPTEIHGIPAHYILDLIYQELCEECRKWRVGGMEESKEKAGQ